MEEAEDAGNNTYQSRHMSAIFKEGFSFSGFERDLLALSLEAKRYLDISGVSGIDSITDGRGSVFADFDNDGDNDVFLTTVQGEAHHLFRNNIGQDNGFLRVTLEGTASGRDAFGALVRVKTSRGIQTKIKAGGSGFVSQNDPRLLFGLGDDPRTEWVEIVWPGGAVERHAEIPSMSSVRFVEGEGTPTLIAEHRFSLPDPLGPGEALMARLGIRRGEPLPELALRTLDDKRTGLDDLLRPGRRSLVNIWATYCVPCAREMPELQSLRARLEAAGIDLIGVSIDIETADKVPAFLRDMGINYPIYLTDADSVARLFARGEVLIPASFLLDDRGRVLEVLTGWSEESRRALERLARTEVAGR